MLEKMPELVVPLINEVFGTNYPADIAVEQQRNEHQTKNGEKITDSRLKIADKIYHIECQSTGDAEMVIRMIEYDFAVSLETKQIENGRYKIYFPSFLCIIFTWKRQKRYSWNGYYHAGWAGNKIWVAGYLHRKIYTGCNLSEETTLFPAILCDEIWKKQRRYRERSRKTSEIAGWICDNIQKTWKKVLLE